MKASFLRKALPHVIAVLVFLVVSVVYCKPALEGKVVHQTDVVGYKGTAQQSVEYRAKYGRYPLWTESTFSGMPTYNIALEASLKFLVGNLSTVITLGTPKPISFFLLACITFYFLAMVMGVSSWIGVLSALAYAWSTYDPIIVNVGHETKMLAIGYAPGIIAGLLLSLRKQYMWGAVVIAMFTSMQVNTQHLQVVYYTLMSAGLLTLCYAIYAWKQKEIKSMLIGVSVAAVAGGIGIATMAVLILPVQDLAKDTMRGGRTELTKKSTDPGGNAGPAKGLDRDYAFAWSYGIPETFTLIVPRSAGGGSDGKEVGEDSKLAEKLTETFGMPADNAVQYASLRAYWGAQTQGTSGPVYLGAIVCLLFIIGLVYVRGWAKWWLVSISVLGIVLAWGKNFPAVNYFLFDHLPFYNKFRSPTISLVLPQFAFALLGGLGLQQLFYNEENKAANWKKFRVALSITAGLLVVLAGYYFMASYTGPTDGQEKESITRGRLQQLSQGRQPTAEMQQQAIETGNSLMQALRTDRQSIFGSDLIRSILLIAIAAALIGLYLKDKIKQRQLVLGALIVLSTYDLLAVGLRYLNEDKFVEAADFEGTLAPTAADLQIKQDPEKNFRVFDETGGNVFGQSLESARTSYNHNSIGGYSAAKLGLYQDLIENQLSKMNMRVYDMLNAKYIIQEDPATRQPVARLNPGAYGSCWLVKGIDYVRNGDDEMKALDSVDTRDTVIIQEKYKALVKFEPVADTTASIQLLDNLLEKITYKFSAKTNQFAVFSEIYFENGWSASIDGKKTDYLRVNYLLRGMPVPAGDHTIEFKFEPHSYILGDTITTWTTILVFIGMIAAIVLEWRKRNRKAA